MASIQKKRIYDVCVVGSGAAGGFMANPEKNPTLTITALAARSARHIVEQKRKRNL